MDLNRFAGSSLRNFGPRGREGEDDLKVLQTGKLTNYFFGNLNR